MKNHHLIIKLIIAIIFGIIIGDLALALIVDKYDNNVKNKERKTPPLSELL